MGRIDPAPWNPRADLAPGDPEYERIRRSLDEFGLVEPLVWNQRTGNLVGGHQRLKVLIAEGATEVEVSVVDLAPEREKVLSLALNKVSGRWDEAKLGELLDELCQVPDLDVGITGFDAPEIDQLMAQLGADPDKEEAFDVEAALADESPALTHPGELFDLGRHRLLCGDCTDAGQVKRLMRGERAVLFATDPPYLVNYNGMNHPSAKRDGQKKGSGKNKDWSDSYAITWDDADANSDLYKRFIGVAVEEAIAPNAAWYCWHASRRQAMLESIWEKFGAFVHQQIVWAKDRPILTRSHYMWQHEPCFFGWVKGHQPPRTSDDFLSTVWNVPTVPAGHVVVDEAQDISVPQLRFMAALAGDRDDGLFFAGDLGQRIFQTPFSWKSLGVDVRGRSKTLRICYRTSHQIREHADRLLDPELTDVDGNAETRRGTVSALTGPAPDIEIAESPDGESGFVGGRIREWLNGGVEPHEIAIFVRTRDQLSRARATAQAACVTCIELDSNTEPAPGSISISPMHLAKGLEFRCVAVMACDDEVVPLQERIQAVGDEADLQDVYDTERHLLYVACTRARDHSLVTGVEPASEFLDDLRPDS